jgi:hypothetical protein
MENRAEQRACEAIGNACHSNAFNLPRSHRKEEGGRKRKKDGAHETRRGHAGASFDRKKDE